MTSRLITLLFALTAAGCSIPTSTTPITQQSGTPVPAARIYQPELTVPAPGRTAKVSFLRDAGALGSACTHKILVEGNPAFAIRAGEYQTLYFPPGQYVFTLEIEGGICPKLSVSHYAVLRDGTDETHRIYIPSLTSRPQVVAVSDGSRYSSAIAQGTIREGEYKSRSHKFSVNIRKPSNWAGVPYVITPLDNRGDTQYERVMFHVGDFGEYLVVGARTVSGASVSAMDKDDHRTVLRNISQASLMGWRRDFSALPGITEEAFFDSTYGEAIVRVYRAPKGSFLAKAQGRKSTPDDRFDTNIASIVARRGALVVFVLSQNDSSPDNAQVVKDTAEQVFRSIRILSEKQ